MYGELVECLNAAKVRFVNVIIYPCDPADSKNFCTQELSVRQGLQLMNANSICSYLAGMLANPPAIIQLLLELSLQSPPASLPPVTVTPCATLPSTTTPCRQAASFVLQSHRKRHQESVSSPVSLEDNFYGQQLGEYKLKVNSS
ncbi:hypothetical protein J6590_040801 [Homalodisca vitripennis]|nr:hypothetical protein J6590_040801 [Homalodisca vitripennis]